MTALYWCLRSAAVGESLVWEFKPVVKGNVGGDDEGDNSGDGGSGKRGGSLVFGATGLCM